MSRFFTIVLCLSLLVGGTANAKKKVEGKTMEPFTVVDFNTVKSPNGNSSQEPHTSRHIMCQSMWSWR